ncbi:unnamed protein product, partial [Durusdinium trenchii]
ATTFSHLGLGNGHCEGRGHVPACRQCNGCCCAAGSFQSSSLFCTECCNHAVGICQAFTGFEAMPIAATVWALARIAEVSEHATRHNAFRIQLVRRGCEQLSDFSEQGIANLSFALAAGMKPARSSIQPSSRSKRPE